jgi:hypothetical protein
LREEGGGSSGELPLLPGSPVTLWHSSCIFEVQYPTSPWLLIGDFNLILHASEKNNENLDRNLMSKFRDFVGDQELREVYRHGRLFTWSNERRVPTLTKIDRALVSIDWELAFPNALLQALSSAVSDHTPLHMSMTASFRPKKRFRFELFWLKLDGFDAAVTEGWRCDPNIMDPFARLDACFRNLATFLQSWGDRRVGNLKLQIAMANLLSTGLRRRKILGCCLTRNTGCGER